MLSAAKLEFNKKKFLETNQKYNIFTKELEDFLGEDFYTSPASSTLNMYGCYPGGLLHVLMKACKFSIQINDLLPEGVKQDVNSVVKSTFLSQIGKVFLYCPNKNDWQIKTGKLYDYCDDIVNFRVGEKSLYYALKYGVVLSETEAQAILNIDKENEDKMAKYYSESLTQIIKIGFDLAIMEEKNGKK